MMKEITLNYFIKKSDIGGQKHESSEKFPTCVTYLHNSADGVSDMQAEVQKTPKWSTSKECVNNDSRYMVTGAGHWSKAKIMME